MELGFQYLRFWFEVNPGQADVVELASLVYPIIEVLLNAPCLEVCPIEVHYSRQAEVIVVVELSVAS